MEQKKDLLERRLEVIIFKKHPQIREFDWLFGWIDENKTLKGLNRKENINYYEIMNQKYESFEYLDQIKARREQL